MKSNTSLILNAICISTSERLNLISSWLSCDDSMYMDPQHLLANKNSAAAMHSTSATLNSASGGKTSRMDRAWHLIKYYFLSSSATNIHLCSKYPKDGGLAEDLNFQMRSKQMILCYEVFNYLGKPVVCYWGVYNIISHYEYSKCWQSTSKSAHISSPKAHLVEGWVEQFWKDKKE